MIIIKRFVFGFIASIFLLASFAAAQQPAAVATVEVTPSQKEAEVGQEVRLTVVAKDALGNVVKQAPSTYFAGPFDAAAVDDNGVVKLVGPGEVLVGAIVGGKVGVSKIVVRPQAVKTLEIKAITTPLAAGSNARLEATTRISNGDPRTGLPITWSSDKPAVAAVDAGGVVTGIAPGRATIKATSGTVSGTTTITVIRNTLRSMTIESTATTARTGDVVRFTAKGAPADPFTARWAVSGSGATIYSDGGFVAEEPGTYIVTASSGAISATASIVIKPRTSNAISKLSAVHRSKSFPAPKFG